MTKPTWKKYLTDWNEGLGLVYERFVLNDYLDELVNRYNVRTVLEAPLYGMAGVSGINSVRLVERGCQLTLVDDNWERLQGITKIWQRLKLPANFVYQPTFTKLPFPDNSFDLAWEWAGLWYLPQPETLLRELARVSRRLVLVAMPNRWQVGYLLRKYLLEPDFVDYVDERWANMTPIKQTLQTAGLVFVDEGVLDVPPWPDTVMPAAEVLKRLGLHNPNLTAKFSGDNWTWNTMAYYLNEQPDLRQRVMKYTWLEHAWLPWQIKAIWAHHRYVLGLKISLI